jgi:hypothetical protein
VPGHITFWKKSISALIWARNVEFNEGCHPGDNTFYVKAAQGRYAPPVRPQKGFERGGQCPMETIVDFTGIFGSRAGLKSVSIFSGVYSFCGPKGCKGLIAAPSTLRASTVCTSTTSGK